MSQNHSTASASFLIALVTAACLGCGGGPSDMPEVVPVTGTVTLDGAPLEGATVLFQPESGRSSAGSTDSEGLYKLHYSQDAMGAIPGKHTVRVTAAKEVSGKMDDEGNPLKIQYLPAKYNSQTELTADVSESNPTIDFDLTSR